MCFEIISNLKGIHSLGLLCIYTLLRKHETLQKIPDLEIWKHYFTLPLYCTSVWPTLLQKNNIWLYPWNPQVFQKLNSPVVSFACKKGFFLYCGQIWGTISDIIILRTCNKKSRGDQQSDFQKGNAITVLQLMLQHVNSKDIKDLPFKCIKISTDLQIFIYIYIYILDRLYLKVCVALVKQSFANSASCVIVSAESNKAALIHEARCIIYFSILCGAFCDGFQKPSLTFSP